MAEILQELPAEMTDIGELIMLASNVQQNASPTLSHEAARKQFQKVRISLNTQKSTKNQKWQWAILSMVVALLFIVTITAGAFIFWTAQPVTAASLDNIQGVVAVKTANGDWTIGENNTRVKEGSTLRILCRFDCRDFASRWIRNCYGPGYTNFHRQTLMET